MRDSPAKGRCNSFGSLKILRVTLVNILEDELEVLKIVDGGIELEFRAFEIKTVKVTFA